MKRLHQYLILLLSILIATACGEGKKEGSLFPSHQTYHFETLRTLGYAGSGGSDINEVLKTAARIDVKDKKNESWYAEWTVLAEQTLSKAESLKGDSRGEGRALLRASNYFRTAEFFLHGDDPRKLTAYRKGRESFYAGLKRLEIPHTVSSVPFKEKKLETLFFPGEGKNAATLILMINGYDSIKEETFFALGSESLARGFSFMSYDGPGQGASIRVEDLHMTPDWAPVNRLVLDKILAEHPEIEHVVAVGFSLGSVLATKAAADDPRISALIHYDVFYNFAEAAGSDIPEYMKPRIFGEELPGKAMERNLRISMKFSPEINWALTHGSWVMGSEESMGKTLNSYRYYEISKEAPEVDCPVLLLAGEEDHFVPVSMMEKSLKSFTGTERIDTLLYSAESGGGEHCRAGAVNLWTADVFNWLGEIGL